MLKKSEIIAKSYIVFYKIYETITLWIFLLYNNMWYLHIIKILRKPHIESYTYYFVSMSLRTLWIHSQTIYRRTLCILYNILVIYVKIIYYVSKMWNKTNYLCGFRSPTKINSLQITLSGEQTSEPKNEKRAFMCMDRNRFENKSLVHLPKIPSLKISVVGHIVVD